MPFSTEFTRALHESGITQAQLSEDTGATQPDLSRVARGARTVGPDLLKKIVHALPVQFRSRLLQAWLNDQREEFGEVGDEIKIAVRGEKQTTKPDPLATFDPERRAIVEWVMRAVCDPRYLPMLRVLWKQFEATTIPEGKPSSVPKGRRKS